MPRTVSRDYEPTHKKPHAFAGSTPRGPERWARAALNALENPMSQAAKLYRQRVNLAAGAAELYESNGPLAFLKLETYQWDPIARRIMNERYGTRVDYYTCSVYCATMQAQLDHRNNTPLVTNMVGLLAHKGAVVERRPSREARCQCCDKRIKTAR